VDLPLWPPCLILAKPVANSPPKAPLRGRRNKTAQCDRASDGVGRTLQDRLTSRQEGLLRAAQKGPSSNETAIELGKAEKGQDKAPADKKKSQIVPSLKVLDHQIRRNINSYVRNVKDHQCHIELVPVNLRSLVSPSNVAFPILLWSMKAN
jgi:hypothetical protein